MCHPVLIAYWCLWSPYSPFAQTVLSLQRRQMNGHGWAEPSQRPARRCMAPWEYPMLKTPLALGPFPQPGLIATASSGSLAATRITPTTMTYGCSIHQPICGLGWAVRVRVPREPKECLRRRTFRRCARHLRLGLMPMGTCGCSVDLAWTHPPE